MNPVQRLNAAPRCSATSKRPRHQCRAPAVRGWKVCRFHGARGGAPKGKANGAWQHGRFTDDVMTIRRQCTACWIAYGEFGHSVSRNHAGLMLRLTRAHELSGFSLIPAPRRGRQA